MTEQARLEDLLSHVVLWELKEETNLYIIPCLYGDIEEETEYLIKHGYDATHDNKGLITVKRN